MKKTGDVKNEERLSSVEKLNLISGKWEMVGNLAEPRSAFAVALVPAEQFCKEAPESSSSLSSPLLILYFSSLFTSLCFYS